MNEAVLKALMQLFAMIASIDHKGTDRSERNVLVEYLRQQFSNDLVDRYLEVYDQFTQKYHPNRENTEVKSFEARNELIIKLCDQLNHELEQAQKMFILVFLLDFLKKDIPITDVELQFLKQVSTQLHVNPYDLKDLLAFSYDQTNEVKRKANLLFIDDAEAPSNKDIKHLRVEKIQGRAKVFHIEATNTYVLRYHGEQEITLNGHLIKADRSYIWALGSVIKNQQFGSVYYTWIAGRFIQATAQSNFVFKAENIEFSYGNSPNGIKKFNLNEESGRLIGIIGGSGSGKSTLLKVLSGVLKPKKGRILINGFDIHKNEEQLRGITGYVPQDEFLIKELSVFENLFINAQLSYSHFTEEELHKLVDKALLDFDLLEARNLQVGDALNTFLSGGQRKRLNIALELLREPSVLFVDEPTSGLSSADSEKVMNLLKRQTFKGKLVFANIHQPSSEIFSLFDKLLVVDQGGRVIYYGNPLDAINYFKRASHYVDADESECLSCGNINIDQILRNVEARVVDVNGRLTRQRKTSPDEWYKAYMDKIDPIIQRIKRPFSTVIPESLYKIPKRWEQTKIFFQRDVLAKVKNKQYLIVTLLEAPVLSLLLSFYTRSARDDSGFLDTYSFSFNANLPAYLFMSVIVALFLGLVISAEEIFRDRKLLERERFLSLSRFSYLGSKIFILFIISALQMSIFVVIGNKMLEIEGMFWRYFLILFSASCWANLIGLNISSGFKSVVTIYILVPLILVPQLLFSGVVVDFRNLNKAIYSANSVPSVGDAMTSRWAYEALVVTQFKDNKFEKDIFNFDREMDHSMFKKAYVIPELITAIEKNGISESDDSTFFQSKFISNEIRKIENDLDIQFKGDFNAPSNTYKKILQTFLDDAWKRYHNKYLSSVVSRERILSEKYRLDKEKLIKDKRNYSNNKLESLVKNDGEFKEYIVYADEIVRLKNPIYTKPILSNGRSHFYSSYKNIAGLQIDTFWFNIIVIWLSVAIWFGILYFDILRKLITYFESNKLQRFNRRVFKILKQEERRG